jgi:anti-sigma B factor antagonist
VLNDFTIRVSDEDPSHVWLGVEGEIDLAVAPQLQEWLLGAADVFDHHHIDLDLSGVTFMDSCGLAVLVSVHRQLTAARSHLAVVNAPPMVVKLIELSGIDSYLDIRSAAETVTTTRYRPLADVPVESAPTLDRAS